MGSLMALRVLRLSSSSLGNLFRNTSHEMLVPCSTCGRCGQAFRRRCSCLDFRNFATYSRKPTSPRKLVSALLSFVFGSVLQIIALWVRRAPHPYVASLDCRAAHHLRFIRLGHSPSLPYASRSQLSSKLSDLRVTLNHVTRTTPPGCGTGS